MVDQVLGARFVGGEYVQANRLTGATVGLNVDIAGATTVAAVDEGIFHVASTTWTFIDWNAAGTPANSNHTLLAPGERLLYFPNQYVSVIKLATATDGIIRMTKVE